MRCGSVLALWFWLGGQAPPSPPAHAMPCSQCELAALGLQKCRCLTCLGPLGRASLTRRSRRPPSQLAEEFPISDIVEETTADILVESAAATFNRLMDEAWSTASKRARLRSSRRQELRASARAGRRDTPIHRTISRRRSTGTTASTSRHCVNAALREHPGPTGMP